MRARQREVEIQLPLEPKKTFNRNFASLRKELASVKFGTVFLRLSRENVDDKLSALEAEVVSALMGVVKSAQLNNTKVAQLVEAAFSENWK